MPGYKSSWTGTLQNADILDYLQKQAVMKFTDVGAAEGALSGVERQGMLIYVDPEVDPTGLYLFTGAEWQPYLTEWQDYTPAWTNLTIGGGTQVASLRYIGGDLRVRGKLTLAADTTGSGSAITQTIPNSETSDGIGAKGTGAYNDSGTGIYPMVTDVGASATSFNFFHAASSGAGVLTNTSPATFANGDTIGWDITIPLTY
jgi:hypothetical protein